MSTLQMAPDSGSQAEGPGPAGFASSEPLAHLKDHLLLMLEGGCQKIYPAKLLGYTSLPG